MVLPCIHRRAGQIIQEQSVAVALPDQLLEPAHVGHRPFSLAERVALVMTVLVLLLVILNGYPVLQLRLVRTGRDLGAEAEVASDWALRRGHTLLAETRVAHVEGLMDGEPRREVKAVHHGHLVCDFLDDL